jgi:hypothetical protein
MGRDYS